MGSSPETAAGANYGLHAPVEDVTRPVGDWNQARIVVRGPRVEHWMNGVKIVEYELWTDEWRALVAKTKFAEWPGYGMAGEGHIGLQDHGDPGLVSECQDQGAVRAVRVARLEFA